MILLIHTRTVAWKFCLIGRLRKNICQNVGSHTHDPPEGCAGMSTWPTRLTGGLCGFVHMTHTTHWGEVGVCPYDPHDPPEGCAGMSTWPSRPSGGLCEYVYMTHTTHRRVVGYVDMTHSTHCRVTDIVIFKTSRLSMFVVLMTRQFNWVERSLSVSIFNKNVSGLLLMRVDRRTFYEEC